MDVYTLGNMENPLMETPCQPVVAETPPQVQRLGAIGLRGGVVRGSARSLAAVRLVGGVNGIALLRLFCLDSLALDANGRPESDPAASSCMRTP